MEHNPAADATSDPFERPAAHFEEIVRHFAPRLLGVARRILRDETEAQDALQDALLSAHRNLDCFRGESQIGSWLFKITVNAALMRLRRRKRLAEEPLQELEPKFLPDGHRESPDPAWCQDPEAKVGSQQLCALVFEEMARLPQAHRDVLLLRDVRGLSTDEAAQVLSIRPGALKVRLHRARCALRELMKRHLVEAPSI